MSGDHFRKPPLSIREQIALLEDRGMHVPDRERAKHYLRFVGYYRLSGYWYPFQHRDGGPDHDRFRDEVTFEMALDRYVLDRELRVHIMDAVEHIEVAARAVISNTMSERYGAHWFLDPGRFHREFDHDRFHARVLEECGIDPRNPTKQPEFVKHYVGNYGLPKEPPSWMVFETLSFGAVSQVFKNLPDGERKQIAEHSGLPRDRMDGSSL
jgi:abortive infection bacteriophage resistance protein